MDKCQLILLTNQNISCHFVIFIINDDIMGPFKIIFDFMYIYIYFINFQSLLRIILYNQDIWETI